MGCGSIEHGVDLEDSSLYDVWGSLGHIGCLLVVWIMLERQLQFGKSYELIDDYTYICVLLWMCQKT
jgi:hypothetical protein